MIGLSQDKILKATRQQHAKIHKNPFNIAKKKCTNPTEALKMYLQKHEQMYHIYLALEAKQDKDKIFPQLRQHFPELFDRAALIREDIYFIRKILKLNTHVDLPPLASTQYLTQTIDNADTNQWLAIFLVRTLADMNGGQFTRARLNNLFGHPPVFYYFSITLNVLKRCLCKNKHIQDYLEDTDNSYQRSYGTLSYHYSTGKIDEFKNYLPKINLNESDTEQVLEHCRSTFKSLNSIFTELHKRNQAAHNCSLLNDTKIC